MMMVERRRNDTWMKGARRRMAIGKDQRSIGADPFDFLTVPKFR